MDTTNLIIDAHDAFPETPQKPESGPSHKIGGASMTLQDNCGESNADLNACLCYETCMDTARCCVLKIDGMFCSNCSSAIEKAVSNLKSVQSCEVDLINEKATVWYFADADISPEDICNCIEDIGFAAAVCHESNKCPDSQVGGQAHLHLMVPSDVGAVVACIKAQVGILDVTANGVYLLVTYNPSEVGARNLLAVLNDSGHDVSIDSSAGACRGQTFISELVPLNLVCALVLTSCILVVCWVLPCFQHCLPWLQRQVFPNVTIMTLLMCALATPVQLWCGYRFHIGAYHAITSGVWDMNVLISLSTGLTFAYSFGVVAFAAFAPKVLGCHHFRTPPSSYFEAPCMVITFILIGKWIESWAKRQTSESLRLLLGLQPRTAHLLPQQDGIAKAENISAELIQIGDVLQVFPGEAAPADGRMVSESGTAQFDESLLTGESKPVTKHKGDFIIGGSKCVTGRTEMKIERLGSKSMLSQITALMERAQLTRAPVQSIADSVAHRFVPCVVALAMITWCAWFLLVFRFKSIDESSILGHGVGEWRVLDKVFFVLEHGLTVLLVACPCALGLATPTAVMTSTGVAAKHGILVRTGAVPLELGSKVTHVVLDKTGTLTCGRPAVTKAAAMHPGAATPCNDNQWDALIAKYQESLAASPPFQKPSRSLSLASMSWIQDVGTTSLVLAGPDKSLQYASRQAQAEQALWWAIGCAELSSEHPLAKELVEVASIKSRAALTKPASFENKTGVGVKVSLSGIEVQLTSAAHMFREAEGEHTELSQWCRGAGSDGSTVIAVSLDGYPVAGIALKDVVASHARHCVTELHMAGIEVWMCTGDCPIAAHTVARECGIDASKVVSQALPENKVEVINKLRASKAPSGAPVIAMIGDGVNDAPALAAADIGIAIGAGHNVTVDAADVVLVRLDLRDLITFFALSKRTIRTIWQNFLWAFLFNISALPIAAGALWIYRVHLTPQMAACLMLSSSLLVVFSSLSLKRFKPKQLACCDV